MVEVTLDLVSTVASNWASTPSTAESLHHTLLNEAVLDTGTYVSCGAEDKEGEFNLADIPEGYSHLTALRAEIDLAGVSGPNNPGLLVELRFNGGVLGFTRRGMDTGGTSTYIVAVVNVTGLLITRDVWNSSSKTIYWKSFDGDGSYPDFRDWTP